MRHVLVSLAFLSPMALQLACASSGGDDTTQVPQSSTGDGDGASDPDGPGADASVSDGDPTHDEDDPQDEDADDEEGTGSTDGCGDGVLAEGVESCDDGDTKDGNGCTKDCNIEPGWQCPAAGLACVAAACGDGIVAGVGALGEECDDHDNRSLDGCDEHCKVEDGWACDSEGCHRTTCGDGVVEGTEGCEDDNSDPFDACGNCQARPKCGVGPCDVVCGDGILFPEEDCEDGNTLDGDGCSAACKVEDGWTCQVDTAELGDTLQVPAVFRDFISNASAENLALRHPDFHDTVGSQGVSPGIVGDELAADGKPRYTSACEKGKEGAGCKAQTGLGSWQTHSEALFSEWYHGGAHASEYVSTLTLDKVGEGVYSFASPLAGFFPVDGQGWIKSGEEIADPGCTGGHNFGFTSEVRDYFVFRGGESLTFSGDDDVWVFIGGKLALDLGGVHGEIDATIALGADGAAACTSTGYDACSVGNRQLGLQVGRVYEIALFHAERRGCGANFRLDLAGFERAQSLCQESCGDGVVTAGEQCDDGNRIDGDACSNECKFNVIVK